MLKRQRGSHIGRGWYVIVHYLKIPAMTPTRAASANQGPALVS
jgi:hypothetical protein